MQGEIDALASELVLEEGASVEALLTTTRGYVNDELAAVYGVSAPGTDELVATELDRGRRRGLLTRAALLAVGANAVEGDPTKRGVMIRQRFLCGETGSPLPGVAPLPPPGEGLTVRQRHEQHFFADASAPCITCHRRTDLIGFGLGHFDAIGRWQDRENGLTIDPSGVVVELDGADREFDDHDGLIDLLATSGDVRLCMERQWLRFALGRIEVRADDASLRDIWQRFEASEFRIRELLVAIAGSRSFRHRAPAAGEGVAP